MNLFIDLCCQFTLKTESSLRGLFRCLTNLRMKRNLQGQRKMKIPGDTLKNYWGRGEGQCPLAPTHTPIRRP